MIRRTAIACTILLSVSAQGTLAGRTEIKTTWTGWFSDQGCAAAKVKSGDITPNGTACVKKCLGEGAAPVFVSEQAKNMYAVKDHGSLMADVGYRLEVTGIVDENAKTISIRSVKRLSEIVPDVRTQEEGSGEEVDGPRTTLTTCIAPSWRRGTSRPV